MEQFALYRDAMVCGTGNDLAEIGVVALNQLGDEVTIVQLEAGLTVGQ